MGVLIGEGMFRECSANVPQMFREKIEIKGSVLFSQMHEI
jgi:hypothetical protein